MRIAIASGKGGTGKTTVAVNLAQILAKHYENVVYADCDVEAANGHIFLKPEIRDRQSVTVAIPKINQNRCDGCGDCSKICHYSAIIVLKGKVLLYPELCHSCGGCQLVCKPRAITEVNREIGVLEEGRAGELTYIGGHLNIGEASAVPLIKRVKRAIGRNSISIIDSPPGTSCPMIEAVRDSDHVLLVTEPTPFGLNDLRLAVETVRTLKIPFSVIINRYDIGDKKVEEYCDEEGIPILLRIPFSRKIAEVYSHGDSLIENIPEQAQIYERLAGKLVSNMAVAG